MSDLDRRKFMVGVAACGAVAATPALTAAAVEPLPVFGPPYAVLIDYQHRIRGQIFEHFFVARELQPVRCVDPAG